MAEAKKVHGRAKVGIVPAGTVRPFDPTRAAARLGRIRDALTRAEGDRKAALEAEAADIEKSIGENREQAEALVKSLNDALAATAPK